jgi:hypothetical protein
LDDLEKTRLEYEKKCPGSLNEIFPYKLPKEEAVSKHERRRNIQTELQPSGTLSDSKNFGPEGVERHLRHWLKRWQYKVKRSQLHMAH